jgi:hypothetical protein
MNLLRAFLAVAAAIAVAFAAVVASLTAPDADAAASTCAGNLIFSKPIRDADKTKIGELNVYWDAATKKNCAVTMHAGRTWDKKLHTRVWLQRCAKGVKAGQFCKAGDRDKRPNVVDDGDYRFRAGPVSLRAAGRCILVQGGIATQGIWRLRWTRLNYEAAFCN